MLETVYVKLLNEGTDVWRPVACVVLESLTFLIPEQTEVPTDEIWQFLPGSKVRCEYRTLSDNQEVLVAYSLIEQ